MTANPLTELAERVQALTEACRETDREILFATFPKERTAIFDSVKHISTMTGRDGEPWFNPLADRTDCPYYTASLDAAMTLVPEGADFYFEVEQVMGGFCNYLYVTGGGSMAPSHDFRGKGGKLHPSWKEAVAALPREISATALRALAASESSHG